MNRKRITSADMRHTTHCSFFILLCVHVCTHRPSPNSNEGGHPVCTRAKAVPQPLPATITLRNAAGRSKTITPGHHAHTHAARQATCFGYPCTAATTPASPSPTRTIPASYCAATAVSLSPTTLRLRSIPEAIEELPPQHVQSPSPTTMWHSRTALVATTRWGYRGMHGVVVSAFSTLHEVDEGTCSSGVLVRTAEQTQPQTQNQKENKGPPHNNCYQRNYSCAGASSPSKMKPRTLAFAVHARTPKAAKMYRRKQHQHSLLKSFSSPPRKEGGRFILRAANVQAVLLHLGHCQ